LSALTGRRRKIRCIFKEGEDSCKDCQERGTTCTAQGIDQDEPSIVEKSDDTEALQRRVAELEGLVKQLMDAKNDTDVASGTASPRAFPVEALNQLRSRIADGVSQQDSSDGAINTLQRANDNSNGPENGLGPEPAPIMNLFTSVMVCLWR